MSEPFNLATHFLDRHMASGRGSRVALFVGDRSVTYAELARLANRVGNVLRDAGVRKGQRVLLALSDGDEFVATWYGAQKIGAVTAEVYPFLQPKDYEYYLGYTEAVAVIADAVTLPALRTAGAKEAFGHRRSRRRAAAGRASVPAPGGRRAGHPRSRSDHCGRRRDLEVHHRQHRRAQGVRAHPAQPDRSFERYAVPVLGLGEDDACSPCPSCSSATRATWSRCSRSASARPGSCSPSAARRT